MAHMDDILELLNMPSWSDIGGLRNQLDFNSATAASGAEAGSTISASASASASATSQVVVKSEQQQQNSSNSLPVPQDARGVNLSSEDMYLGSQMHRQFGLDNSQVLGINCNVMANQSSGTAAMHLGGESSMLPSSCNMFATPSGPLGLHFDPSAWRQQPVIGDIQPYPGQELFSSSNTAISNLYGTTRYRDPGGTPINLRINRDHGRVFAGYPGPQLGHPRPPVQALQLQPNTGSRVYRTQTVPQPAMGGAPRPRVRARRGQATDPHSIAERQRRERIAERVKELQMLVPNACKTDRAMLLDEIIEYVKFLQIQAKILDISHSHGAVPSLLPTEYGNTLGQSNGTTSEALASIEREVAQLMDQNMDAALQFMQSKGFCLMPISMAAALSSATKGVHQPILSADKLETSTSTVVTERPSTGSGQK